LILMVRSRSPFRFTLFPYTTLFRSEAGHGDYAASKGALVSLVKGLCVELAPRGITVNSVAPGWVDTDLSAAVLRTEQLERAAARSEEHTSELQSRENVVCRLLLEKK